MAGTDIARVQLHQPGDKPSLFQKGHPRYGRRWRDLQVLDQGWPF
jgi:hypothetical protein